MSSARRVVITGLGATTPLGGSFADTWDGLLAGRSGMRTMDFPWVEEFEMPAKFAAPRRVGMCLASPISWV